MKCNIDDLVNNIKDKLGDVDFDNLLNGCLGNNSIRVNNDFFDDEDLDVFDNDENGILVNPRVRNRRNKCSREEREEGRTDRRREECNEDREREEERATIGCVQDVCKEVAKRIGTVRVHSKFGCACGENLSCVLVVLQKKDCCGEFKDVAEAFTNERGVCEFGCVETGCYRVVQVIDGRHFNPPCYIPCDTFEITPQRRCIEITVVNTLNPIAQRMLRERQEARRIMRIIEREQNRSGRRNNNSCRRNNRCCGRNEGWWVIILLFLAFGCGGFGLGCF